MQLPLLDNGGDIVILGRTKVTRQQAFQAYVHIGILPADARRKASALPEAQKYKLKVGPDAEKLEARKFATELKCQTQA